MENNPESGHDQVPITVTIDKEVVQLLRDWATTFDQNPEAWINTTLATLARKSGIRQTLDAEASASLFMFPSDNVE